MTIEAGLRQEATPMTTTLTGERADLLRALDKARGFLRFTVRDLDDDRARLRPTASALSLGGLVKHVSMVEANWAQFIVDGAAAMAMDESSYETHRLSFELLPDETLVGVLAAYDEVAARTDELVRSVPDLDAAQALPKAPWFEPGAAWTARTV